MVAALGLGRAGLIGNLMEDTLGMAYDIGNPPSTQPIHDSVKEEMDPKRTQETEGERQRERESESDA